MRHDMWVGQQLGACAELRAWCLRLHPSSPVRVGNVRLDLIPPGWWASLHGRGTLLTVSGALVVHGTCAQPLESDVQSTNVTAFMAGRKDRPAGARCCDGSIVH